MAIFALPLGCGLALAIATGCAVTGDFSATNFRCDQDPRCPAGQRCIEGVCRSDDAPDSGIPGDGGGEADGGGDPGQVPALLRWRETTPLPEPRDFSHPHAGAAGGFLYFAGGFGGDPATEQASVYFTEVLADGALGGWEETSALPLPRAVGDVVTAGDRIYLVGGADEGGVAQTTVYRADLAADGTLGAWTVTTPLPAARKGHSSFAANGYIYAIGGEDESRAIHATAFFAELEPDGEIGPWSITTEFPEPRTVFAGVFAGDKLYVLGGADAATAVRATAFVAPVNQADGTIGPWSSTTDLPGPRRSGTAFARQGHIYLVGGITEGGVTGETIHSPVGTDGALGDWAPNVSLPAARARQASVLLNGFFYVIGGSGAATAYYTTTD